MLVCTNNDFLLNMTIEYFFFQSITILLFNQVFIVVSHPMVGIV